MKLPSLLLTIFILAGSNAKAQWYIEPIAGYQVDINNHVHFKGLKTVVNFCNTISRRYQIIFQLQKNWPLAYYSSDTAFTTNTGLPLTQMAAKTISPVSFSFGLGQRFKIAGNGSNFLFVSLYTGLQSQQVKVAYDYDKNNYIILNPDKTATRSGLYIGCGASYIRQLGKQRLLVQLEYSFLLQSKIYYPGTFNYVTPLSVELGYAIPIVKSKNAKK